MPTSIKVLPPERLTDGQLSEEEFQCYQTELEVFLELEAKFIPFLKGGNYETWEAGENALMQTGPLAADQSSTTNNVMNKSITNHDVLREAVHIDDQPLYRGPLGCCLIQVSAGVF